MKRPGQLPGLFFLWEGSTVHPMKAGRIGWLAIAGLPAMLAMADSAPIGLPASRRIEMRLEIAADRLEGPVRSCQAVQIRSAAAPVAFAFWGVFDEGEASGRCGAGATPEIAKGTAPAGAATPVGAALPEQGAVPVSFLLQEITADVGWDGGAMDPGPLGAFQVFLTLKTRQRSESSSEGPPRFGAPILDRRAIRLEPGEEFIMPLPVDARGRESLGVRQLWLRVRASWAGREEPVEFGALAVSGAVPGSEVVLDGGVAGHAGADGSLTLPAVPVGLREVRLRAPSGAVITRTVVVMRERTIPITPEGPDGGSATASALKATGKNGAGFQEYRRDRDGAPMIEIPEGEFLMGNPETEGAPQAHTVSVSRFLIDKLPLTVARYRKFAEATGRPLPPDPWWGVHDDHPVAFVRWDEGKAYCEWAGARLPTEAEREKAARGTDGRTFPWGSDPPSDERAVYGRHWGEQGNDTAGALPAGAGPYGMLDGEGNMWEFCEDWYSPDYYATSPAQDPPGPKTGRSRIVRGGSWDSRWVTLSCARRNFAYTGYREGDFGFRCAANPPR
jgi:sulfatase modifying factor 1